MFGSPPPAGTLRGRTWAGCWCASGSPGPVGEQHRRARHQCAGRLESFVDLLRRQGTGSLLLVGTVDSLDVKVGRHFGFAVEEGLAHDQRSAPGRHGQPVPFVVPAAHDQLESAVGVDVELRGLDVSGRRHPAALPVVSGLRAEAEVFDSVAPAGDPVVVVAANGGRLVVVVRVVASQLDRLVGHPVQHGRSGVGVLHERHQSAAGQAGQVPVALRLTERITRCSREGERGSRGLQRIAELLPCLSADNPPLGRIRRRHSPQLQRQQRDPPKKRQQRYDQPSHDARSSTRHRTSKPQPAVIRPAARRCDRQVFDTQPPGTVCSSALAEQTSRLPRNSAPPFPVKRVESMVLLTRNPPHTRLAPHEYAHHPQPPRPPALSLACHRHAPPRSPARLHPKRPNCGAAAPSRRRSPPVTPPATR